MSDHEQIKWIEDSPAEKKKYRAMVVGWQNALVALNILINAYNHEYLKAEEEKKKDPHQGMTQIAIKKQVIASLRDLKQGLYKWQHALRSEDFISEAVDAKRGELLKIIEQAEKLTKIRNVAFHHGDFTEEPDALVSVHPERLRV